METTTTPPSGNFPLSTRRTAEDGASTTDRSAALIWIGEGTGVGAFSRYRRRMPFVVVATTSVLLFVWRARKERRPLRAAACWLLMGTGLGVFGIGAINSLYFEPTTEAMRRASVGHWILLLGVVLGAFGGVAEHRRRRPCPRDQSEPETHKQVSGRRPTEKDAAP